MRPDSGRLEKDAEMRWEDPVGIPGRPPTRSGRREEVLTVGWVAGRSEVHGGQDLCDAYFRALIDVYGRSGPGARASHIPISVLSLDVGT